MDTKRTVTRLWVASVTIVRDMPKIEFIVKQGIGCPRYLAMNSSK